MLESLKYAHCVVAMNNWSPCQDYQRSFAQEEDQVWRIQPFAIPSQTQFNSKLRCSFLLITKMFRQEQKWIPLRLSSLFVRYGINMSSSSLYYCSTSLTSITYAEQNHPCSRSHGRTSSSMYHLRGHFQASDCSQTTCQSCPFEDQGNLFIVWESIHGQKVASQASTYSSPWSMVTKASWGCKWWRVRSL